MKRIAEEQAKAEAERLARLEREKVVEMERLARLNRE